MIVLSGWIEFDEVGARDAAVETSAPIQAITRSQPGCLAYAFSADPVDGRRLLVHEEWADEASLRAHFTHDDYQDMRQVLRRAGRTKAQTEGVPRVHLVTRSSAVYQADGSPLPSYFGAAEQTHEEA